jgi:hypothetical protein
MYDGTLGTQSGWEALVTFQQLLILADAGGNVDMTKEAIANRTSIPLDIIEKGIHILEAPDRQSRTPDNEGRRILRLAKDRDWGWFIVNYVKYSNIRNQEERREYMRLYQRDRRKKLKEINESEECKSLQSLQKFTKLTSNTSKQCKPNQNQESELLKRRTVNKIVNNHELLCTDSFVAFYEAYPKKRGKKDALKAWLALSPDADLVRMMMEALAIQKQSPQWRKEKGEFVPYPGTWLNGRRWEDEPMVYVPPPSPGKRDWL